ncbi:hypothetical protein EVAR_66707_1 [Eumeta japonica]|uniref:SWIM-type domain-containing protein n=1 Tax=Eumeta variegata TaxID=151549 RepID=A0A4C1ZT62_EUMVA|nr:hypothetical protein EVAR_66707_1 [Eumeta japonica]
MVETEPVPTVWCMQCRISFPGVAASRSFSPSYGDDAASHAQLKCDGKMCTLKGKIFPEHKVHAKLYAVTLIVDEEKESVVSVECHGCVAPKGGCKHTVAFLVWTHRRSEEPS